ncbi:hypothetical protein L2E82_15934 [Cichorium intybus]|uniref:Uncharacterized protein n=1 Tax=Cichorium intybus TaxID=13427 RepID=A0ACB9F538_CICIN|nr:hypothetical protein L2E82_15934 [Cichorium intybus]
MFRWNGGVESDHLASEMKEKNTTMGRQGGNDNLEGMLVPPKATEGLVVVNVNVGDVEVKKSKYHFNKTNDDMQR